VICPVVIVTTGRWLMRRTELLQEIRKMRFEEAYQRWNVGRLTQAEAAQLLGPCERSFRRYVGAL